MFQIIQDPSPLYQNFTLLLSLDSVLTSWKEVESKS